MKDLTGYGVQLYGTATDSDFTVEDHRRSLAGEPHDEMHGRILGGVKESHDSYDAYYATLDGAEGGEDAETKYFLHITSSVSQVTIVGISFCNFLSGAVFVEDIATGIVIRQCRFVKNGDDDVAKGGGLYIKLPAAGSIDFQKVWFHSNMATKGGGMYIEANDDSVIEMEKVYFDDNVASKRNSAGVVEKGVVGLGYAYFMGNGNSGSDDTASDWDDKANLRNFRTNANPTSTSNVEDSDLYRGFAVRDATRVTLKAPFCDVEFGRSAESYWYLNTDPDNVVVREDFYDDTSYDCHAAWSDGTINSGFLPNISPDTETCFDGIQNGDETAVDCGGVCVATCEAGKACSIAADCAVTDSCVSEICTAPPCGDGTKNGAETDIDCGGGTCDTCAEGGGCSKDTDCGATHYCLKVFPSDFGTCQMAACSLYYHECLNGGSVTGNGPLGTAPCVCNCDSVNYEGPTCAIQTTCDDGYKSCQNSGTVTGTTLVAGDCGCDCLGTDFGGDFCSESCSDGLKNQDGKHPPPLPPFCSNTCVPPLFPHACASPNPSQRATSTAGVRVGRLVRQRRLATTLLIVLQGGRARVARVSRRPPATMSL